MIITDSIKIILFQVPIGIENHKIKSSYVKFWAWTTWKTWSLYDFDFIFWERNKSIYVMNAWACRVRLMINIMSSHLSKINDVLSCNPDRCEN